MSDNTTLDDRFVARCTTEEKEAIEEAAYANNRSLSDYVRLVMKEAAEQGKKV